MRSEGIGLKLTGLGVKIGLKLTGLGVKDRLLSMALLVEKMFSIYKSHTSTLSRGTFHLVLV